MQKHIICSCTCFMKVFPTFTHCYYCCNVRIVSHCCSTTATKSMSQWSPTIKFRAKVLFGLYYLDKLYFYSSEHKIGYWNIHLFKCKTTTEPCYNTKKLEFYMKGSLLHSSIVTGSVKSVSKVPSLTDYS